MNAFETPADMRASFDALLAGAQRQLRLYDHDAGLFDLDHPPRHAALRAWCAAGGGRRIELLFDDISRVARDHPRLMQLLRDFGHVVEIRQADPAAPRPDQAFALADHHGVLFRADKSSVHGTLRMDEARDSVALRQSFESMWQRSQASVTATTLGL